MNNGGKKMVSKSEREKFLIWCSHKVPQAREWYINHRESYEPTSKVGQFIQRIKLIEACEYPSVLIAFGDMY
jgi:hypothetical protein